MHVVEVDNVKLLQVKNPWGEVELPSEYSDKSPKWTKEFIKKVESSISVTLDFKDDGLFFIKFDEFQKHFEDITVGFYMQNAK